MTETVPSGPKEFLCSGQVLSACQFLGFNNIFESPSENSRVTDVREAVRRILCMGESESKSLHSIVHPLVSTLYTFLSRHLKSGNQHEYFNSEESQAISEMFHPSLLSVLFYCRHCINVNTTTNCIEYENYHALITCIDILLDCICDAILFFSGQGSLAEDDQGCSQELAFFNLIQSGTYKQKLLSVIVQLPSTWHEVIATLHSRFVSAASKRTVLTLLFGAYIFGPQIVGWSNLSALPDDIRHAIKAYISGLVKAWPTGTETTGVEEFYADRMHVSQATLALTLLSLDCSDDNSTAAGSPFQPATQGVLIVLLRAAIKPFSSALYQLNNNRYRLLRWGLTVPWAWQVWNSKEIGPIETIIPLTETWLYHCTDELQMVNILRFAPKSAALKVLLTFLQSSTVELTFVARLTRLRGIWAIYLLCTNYREKINPDLVCNAAQVLVGLTPDLSWDCIVPAISVHEAVIELVLSLPEADLYKPSIYNSEIVSKSAKKGKLALLNSMLTLTVTPFTGIETITSIPTSAVEPETDVTARIWLEYLIAFSTLEFLRTPILTDLRFILWQIPAFVSSGYWSTATQRSAIVLFVCLCDRQIVGSDAITLDFISNNLLPHIPTDDIDIASAIACGVHKLSEYGYEHPMTLFLLWDYLRDALLLLMQNFCPERFLKNVYNTICSALSLLIDLISQEHGRILSSSPWTVTLHKHLTSSVVSPNGPLVGQIEELLAGDPMHPLESGSTKCQVLPYYQDNMFHILCVAKE